MELTMVKGHITWDNEILGACITPQVTSSQMPPMIQNRK